jgi:hypothetical protein
MPHDFSNNDGVQKALDETMDTSKLTLSEHHGLRVLLVEAYYAGRDSGILSMGDKWKKSIDKTFAHLERNLV